MKYTERRGASVVTRACFVEDTALEQIKKGVSQYVLPGTGLDSFAQRNAEIWDQAQKLGIRQKY